MIFSKIKNTLKIPYIKIKSFYLSRLHNKKYEAICILGNNYNIIRGTLQSTSDYDDAWLYFLSQKANVVFDIGCHIGKSALIISQSDSIKRMVLVDPNPLSLSLAAENLIINNMSQNAIFIPKAAYVNSGDKIQLWTMKGPFAGASLNVNFTETGTITKEYFEVETITLDEITDIYNSYPDLIKIDVEGAENYVLQGATEIAKRENAIFIVEVHSSKKVSIMENTDRILHWCKQNNYRSYYLSEHREIKNSDSVKNRGRYHLLLIHKNTNYPEGLKNIKQGANLEDIGK